MRAAAAGFPPASMRSVIGSAGSCQGAPSAASPPRELPHEEEQDVRARLRQNGP
jgi:hypothetical protein